jgi:hypothetical protein
VLMSEEGSEPDVKAGIKNDSGALVLREAGV